MEQIAFTWTEDMSFSVIPKIHHSRASFSPFSSTEKSLVHLIGVTWKVDVAAVSGWRHGRC